MRVCCAVLRVCWRKWDHGGGVISVHTCAYQRSGRNVRPCNGIHETRPCLKQPGSAFSKFLAKSLVGSPSPTCDSNNIGRILPTENPFFLKAQWLRIRMICLSPFEEPILSGANGQSLLSDCLGVGFKDFFQHPWGRPLFQKAWVG